MLPDYCPIIKQGHRHNGDQAARRLHILCSFYVRSSAALATVVPWHHFTASQCVACSQRQGLLYCWHFRRPTTGWLKFERRTFRPPSALRLNECQSWGHAKSNPANRFLFGPRWHIWPISWRFFLAFLAGSKIVCFRPSVRPSDPDTMIITTVEAST